MTVLDYRIAGIPCQIDLLGAYYQAPQPRADSRDDFYGGYALEWQVLDRKGYPAAWLAKKLTPAICDDIETKLINNLRK